MNTKTSSVVVHKTAITADHPSTDGGRALLNEAFSLIRNARQQGTLIAHFGQGGSLSSLVFEETEKIAQKDIVFADNLSVD